jgi:hypothetical protein
MTVTKYTGPMGPHTAQAVSQDAKTYPDGNKPNQPVQVTRSNGWGGKTVRVACDYEVGVKNPKTGKNESVVFTQVNQDRPAGWGLPGFDPLKDVYSKVDTCEGINYDVEEHIDRNGFLVTMTAPTAIERFNIDKIPELKARVEHYEQTGETGNPKKR